MKQAIDKKSRRVLATFLHMLLAVIASALTFHAQETWGQSISKEYQVKAVFLFNFAQFVEWPAEAFADDQAPLVIGILGEDPYGDFLDETVKGEKVGNHPLVVQRYRHVEEIKACHVLFISQSEMGRLDGILEQLKGRSILTVGDSEGFSKRGGMVRFVTEKGKIRFRICVEAARAVGLTISSRLLRLADIVTPGKD